MQSFLTRLLVACIAIPALLYLFHRGGDWLLLLVAVLLILATYEAQRLSRLAGAAYALLPSVALVLAIPWVSLRFAHAMSWPIWLVLIVLVAAIPVVRTRDVRAVGVGIAAQIGCVLWVGLGLGAVIALRQSSDGSGFWWLVLLFANLWVGDTAAYLFGVWLGKTKLSPHVSPKKTVVGAVAQIIASGIVGAVFAMAGWISAPTVMLVAASLLIGIVGQLGDLFESVLKRAAGEKDSSNLIPGHGGVLDRFDSAMFAAPSLYALLQIWPR